MKMKKRLISIAMAAVMSVGSIPAAGTLLDGFNNPWALFRSLMAALRCDWLLRQALSESGSVPWRRIGRLNREIRRRTSVIGIFPNESSYVRLVTNISHGIRRGLVCFQILHKPWIHCGHTDHRSLTSFFRSLFANFTWRGSVNGWNLLKRKIAF